MRFAIALCVTVAVLAAVPACRRKPAAKKGARIVWNAKRKLAWADFQAPFNAKSGFGAESMVGIATQFECKGGKFTYLVQATFDPKDSWVDPKKRVPELLAHEQGHFDFAELYARKMRAGLRQLSGVCATQGSLSEKTGFESKRANDGLRAAQRQYDRIAEHGINRQGQKLVLEVLAQNLADMAAYTR
ncbi:MAG: DUF922 domain-containing protein [Acidobacteria bacterium]|nr:DUF922 domain-containing protein [Acidobacteriota bacterium]